MTFHTHHTLQHFGGWSMGHEGEVIVLVTFLTLEIVLMGKGVKVIKHA